MRDDPIIDDGGRNGERSHLIFLYHISRECVAIVVSFRLDFHGLYDG